MARKQLTLCIIHQKKRVLLGMKKRGFGVGRFNGFGGKVEHGETIEAAAIRETQEEAHITPLDLVKLGVINFAFSTLPDIFDVHIFKCTTYTGTAGESEEMAPAWFDEDHIPFESMWKDDPYWFKFFLENKKFTGRFYFDAQDQIIEYELQDLGQE